ncbi:ATP-binding protein [Accumulibacter sp.]|uniref:ATP-binding protein n=1 Tax=Accumulibacter sp. TaxID=2053492 RepID=UPI0025D57B00|nr:ATP-binding protein [Accumulibacter sp.]MCM8611352.1 sensor histidine kinase [Accumulibacter sp.]MCM8635001.1 sensor histidine kinase [Accumulibacter sp.]MCM8639789.1 sensor histidine kinase [Accumulibacter sp.]
MSERGAINLLDNVLRHARAGGEVGIGVQRPGVGRLRRLRFWGDNEGVAANDKPCQRMLQRLSRTDAMQKGSGSGLGLYFVRTLAAPHGGAAGVEHAAGRIRFWVELPAAVDPAPEADDQGG